MDINLKYTLLKIIEKTKDIPNINRGGCCQFASMLSKELQKRNIDFKVTLYNSDSSRTTTIVNDLRNKNSSCLDGVYHVALKIDGFYIDGKSVSRYSDLRSKFFERKKYDYPHRTFKLKAKDLNKYALNGDWCCLYDSETYNPIIQSLISENFKIYDRLANQIIDD